MWPSKVNIWYIFRDSLAFINWFLKGLINKAKLIHVLETNSLMVLPYQYLIMLHKSTHTLQIMKCSQYSDISKAMLMESTKLYNYLSIWNICFTHTLWGIAWHTGEFNFHLFCVTLHFPHSPNSLSFALCFRCKSVYISTRSGAWVVPNYIFGHPTDLYACRAFFLLPWKLATFIFETVIKLVSGNPERSVYW